MTKPLPSSMTAPTSDPVAPICRTFTVEAPIERAFSVFTAKMSLWWPRDHHIGASPLLECVIEPQVGGRWYEVCEDGSQCQWGRVLAWSPPEHLILAWQLDAQFTYDPALVTEVEVRFTALGPRRTQVDFEHRNLDRFGAAALATRGAMEPGWAGILQLYATSTLAPEPAPAG